MIGSKVLLPVSEDAFRELCDEVSARGQGDRVSWRGSGPGSRIDLGEVVLEWNEAAKIARG